jgi:hypothetical protein
MQRNAREGEWQRNVKEKNLRERNGGDKEKGE